MSFSYTVGGKSLTHSRQRKGIADREKDVPNRAKTSTLSSTKSPATVLQRGGKRNSTGEKAGNRKAGSGAVSGAQQRSADTLSSVSKPHQTSTSSAIVTLSDLNDQPKTPQTRSIVNSSPKKSSNKTTITTTSGRKLGPISDSAAGRIDKPRPLPPSSNLHAPESAHQRKTTLNSKLNHIPSDVNSYRTSTNSNKLKTQKLSSNNIKTSSTGRGRGSKDKGSSRVGIMAYNNGRHTTSGGLYSSNSQQVGQGRSDGGDVHPQQASGTSQPQGSSQQPQPQPEESPGSSYRVIPPNPSKRQQMLNKSSQELKALEDYRASKKPTTVYGEAQSTGGMKTQEEARLALEKQHRNKKYEQILKKEKREQEKREREAKENEEKKARARKTAEENERRRKEREEKFLKDEHSRINNNFLKKLETGSKLEQSKTSVSQSPELRELLEMFPNKTPSKLQELLTLTNNDVEKVIELLLD